MAKLNSNAKAAEASKVGYDQKQRWSYLDKKNRKILANKECDCSSLTAGIVWLAGYPIDISGTVWTGNIASLLKKAGWKIYKYTNKNAVKANDVIVREKHHVVFAITKGRWLSAEHDENGKGSGGKAGDQTGKEVVIRNAYEHDWDYICRPPADPKPSPTPVPTTGVIVNESHLASALKKVGASTDFSTIRVRKDGSTVPGTLDTLSEALTSDLNGRKLNSHAVSAFVATLLQESGWLRTTVEYGDSLKYDPYRGRTFEQLTGKSNYADFGAWCVKKDLISDANKFVNDPESLGDLEWAWLGGLFYFDVKSLWNVASVGGFQQVSTGVNLGHQSTTSVPSGWNTRILMYRAFLSVYDKPETIAITKKIDKATVLRMQEFIGATMDGDAGSQTWYLFGRWLGLGDSFSLSSKSDVKTLQKKIGVSSKDQDGVWWMPKSKAYGPQTTAYLQSYLNSNR